MTRIQLLLKRLRQMRSSLHQASHEAATLRAKILMAEHRAQRAEEKLDRMYRAGAQTDNVRDVIRFCVEVNRMAFKYFRGNKTGFVAEIAADLYRKMEDAL